MPLKSHGLACDIFYLFITLSTMSKKLQDDGKMATTTLPPAAHFHQQHTSLTHFQKQQKPGW